MLHGWGAQVAYQPTPEVRGPGQVTTGPTLVISDVFVSIFANIST
jgi:hypothetical protein